jgi:precorrin-2 dehydrogenase/sirohydrochlorin ferrochelatase
MLPIVLDCADWPIVLAGRGHLAVRRLATLDAAGCRGVTVFGPGGDAALGEAAGARFRPGLPGAEEVAAARLLFVAGLPLANSEELATLARRHRVLVNAEDEPPRCDFHMPAMVRRGRLLLTVSTGGASPALAARLRAWLEQRFGPEWDERLERAAAARDKLRGEGRRAELSAQLNGLVDREGWLG